MKKLMLILGLVLVFAGNVFAAGSVCNESFKSINTKNEDTYVYAGVKEVEFQCYGDSSTGAFPSTPFSAGLMEEIKGMYLLVGSTLNGATAPTALYDIALTENGVDILGTGGADRPGTAAVSSQFLPLGSTTYLVSKPIPITNTLTMAITNSSVANGAVAVRFKFVKLEAGTDFNAYNADLAAIAALTCTENQIMKMNGADAWACAEDGGADATTLLGNTWASPEAIGGTAAAAGTFTTLSAAATGFTVDADGDTTVKSITVTRVAGSASAADFYEVPANGDNKVTLKAADSLAADYVVTLPSATVTIPNNPIGGTLGATTNVIPKASGTGTATLQASGITEDGTTVNIGALNLVTTGIIQGGMKISSDADGMDAAAMTAVGLYGTLFIATGAGTWILPTAAAGMSLCLMDSGTAHDLILDATAGDTMRLKGTEQADGVGITNASGSTTGDFICVVAVAANKWSTMGMQGTWASQ